MALALINERTRAPIATDVELVLVAELVVDPHRAIGLVRAVVDRHDQLRELVIAQLP